MWIRTSSEISESVVQLVTDTATHAVVRDDVLALVDCGVEANSEQLLELVSKLLEDPRELHYLLLTHEHFDHVGALPAMRKFNPEVEVIASPAMSEIFTDKEYVASVFARNKEVTEAYGKEFSWSIDDYVDSFRVEHIVRDGDSLQLGEDVEIKVIGLPGHTEHSLAYFIRPDGVIAGGEALGAYYGRQKAYGSAEFSLEEYVKSLERVTTLDVSSICLPHTGAITGEMAPQYLIELRQHLEQFAAQVKERLAAGEIVDEVVANILLEWKELDICPEGPFLAEQEESVRKMVQTIASAG